MAKKRKRIDAKTHAFLVARGERTRAKHSHNLHSHRIPVDVKIATELRLAIPETAREADAKADQYETVCARVLLADYLDALDAYDPNDDEEGKSTAAGDDSKDPKPTASRRRKPAAANA